MLATHVKIKDDRSLSKALEDFAEDARVALVYSTIGIDTSNEKIDRN
jgi:hypothetical protein